MNDKFDELAKGMAKSATRRAALKKFGVGIAGMTLAIFGLVRGARADKPPFQCNCSKPAYGCVPDPQDPNYFANCDYYCDSACKDHTDKHSHCC